jgi:N4-gp56 family major capsid protein
MSNLTGRSEIADNVNNYYDKNLLYRAVANFNYLRFAQVRNLPRKAGSNTIKFRRYSNLSPATTPLTAGVTPSGSALSSTNITATVKQYGDFVTITDFVDMVNIDPILTETSGILGDQAADTLDELTRDVLAACTNAEYGGDATSVATVDSTDIIDEDAVEDAVMTLKLNKAKPITSQIDPSTGYNTESVPACYVGFVHPSTTRDLKDISNYVPVWQYSDPSQAMKNEVGKLDEVRFIESTNAKIRSGEGDSGIDVYSTIIIGQWAYGISRISGEAMHNYIKPFGSGDDPLNQRCTSGWKCSFVAKILNDDFIVRIEHAV